MSHNETAEGHKQGSLHVFEAHVATMGREELEARAIALWQLSWECDRAGVMAEDPGVVEARIVNLRAQRGYAMKTLAFLFCAHESANELQTMRDILRERHPDQYDPACGCHCDGSAELEHVGTDGQVDVCKCRCHARKAKATTGA